MATLASLLIALGIDKGDFDRGMDDVVKKTGSSGGAIQKALGGIGAIAGGVLTVGVAAAGAAALGLAGGLGFAISEAMEAEKVSAQLDAVLRSTSQAAATAGAVIPEEMQKGISKLQTELAELDADISKKRAEIQKNLDADLLRATQATQKQLQSLEARHNDQIANMNASLTDLQSEFEYDRAEAKEDVTRRLTRMEEDYNHDREKLVKELAAAETDEEKAKVQAKLDEFDYEYNTKKKRMEEDAAEAEKDAQEQHDKRVKQLQARIDAENQEYAKQNARLQQEGAARLAEVKERYQEEVNAANARYDEEVAKAKASLGEINAEVKKLQDAAAAISLLPRMDKAGILDLASSLSQVTAFSDDAVISASNVMLTFGAVGKQVFPDAIKSALDMSTALGTDVQSSVIMLGKALQDPINGVGALRKVGASFSEEQEQQIKTMMANGDLVGAQMMIIGEMQKEFGGSAVAYAQTTAGQFEVLKNQLSDQAEAVGTSLLPAITALLGAIAPLLLDLGNRFVTFFQSADFQVWLDKAIDLVVNQLIPGLVDIAKWVWSEVLPAIREIWKWLAENLPPAIEKVSAFWKNELQPALQLVWTWMVTYLPPAMQRLSEIWNTVILPAIKAFWQFTQDYLIPILQSVWRFFSETIPGALSKMKGLWDSDFLAIRTNVTATWENIKSFIDLVKAVFDGDWRRVGEIIREIWDRTWDATKERITSFVDFLKGSFQSALDWIKSINWLQVGIDIILGIGNGMVQMQQWVVETVISIADAIKETVKGFFGIASPSKVMEQLGAYLPLGFGQGMESGFDALAGRVPGMISPLAPAVAGVRSGASGGSIQFIYSPMISTADRYETQNVLGPFIEEKVRSLRR